MTTKMKISIAGLVLFLAVIVVWKIVGANSSADVRRPAAILVQVGHPERSTIVYRLKFTGDVLPIQQANIYSKINGNLERVYVNIGARVEEDQLLALIDTTETAQQEQQTAATYQNTKLTYERTKELTERNLIAKQELDNVETAMKVAKANYEAAATRLGYAHIAAPFKGYITKRFLDAGANVTSNNVTLFTLMDIEEMKILINVLEKDIPMIEKGKKAIITVDAYPGKEFYGTVTRLSQAVDLSTRTMATEIDIPNGEHLLKPGMFANVMLVVDEHKNTLTVGTQSLMKDEKGSFVLTVNGNIAHRKYIRFGVEQDAKVEILSGLQDADTIITTGQQFVKDGALVTIQQ